MRCREGLRGGRLIAAVDVAADRARVVRVLIRLRTQPSDELRQERCKGYDRHHVVNDRPFQPSAQVGVGPIARPETHDSRTGGERPAGAGWSLLYADDVVLERRLQEVALGRLHVIGYVVQRKLPLQIFVLLSKPLPDLLVPLVQLVVRGDAL